MSAHWIDLRFSRVLAAQQLADSP